MRDSIEVTYGDDLYEVDVSYDTFEKIVDYGDKWINGRKFMSDVRAEEQIDSIYIHDVCDRDSRSHMGLIADKSFIEKVIDKLTEYLTVRRLA